MPRRPKPYFRQQTNSWYFSTGGKQYPLGKDREAAFKKFHRMMAEQERLPTESFTLYELAQSYLDWVQANRAESTYKKHRDYLESFISVVGRQLKPTALKQAAVRKWTEKPTWNSTTRNDAIGIVQRMLNWAVEEEYLTHNPLGRIRKPPRKRRDIVYTPEQWKQIRSHVDDCFGDLLDFLFSTGCRPIEARTLQRRHLHGDVIIFPADEAKGDQPRVIYLTERVREIVDRVMREEGPLFRNTQGNPWTKDAIKCRLTRISKKVGFRVIAYGARHSFATNALINGVDSLSVAHLMGHQDASMVQKVYSHLANNAEFLRQQAERATRRADGTDDPPRS